jgi:hypothetical protein
MEKTQDVNDEKLGGEDEEHCYHRHGKQADGWEFGDGAATFSVNTTISSHRGQERETLTQSIQP